MKLGFKHEWIETNIGLMVVITMLAISVAGMVEIIPLFFIKGTVENVAGPRPYTPLELRGRDIYQDNGCFYCHSQMIRPFRDEELRYGHYSLAAESQYDHPFLWGSERTGPDLARIGGKYSNAWHVQHLIDPRSVVSQSIMPGFPWLATTPLDMSDIEARMKALRDVGVPYALTKQEYEADVKKFGPELANQYYIPNAQQSMIEQANANDYDGRKNGPITEMDAVIAYLQSLGNQIDWNKVNENQLVKDR